MIMKKHCISALFLVITLFYTNTTPIHAQSGMLPPPCDDTIDPQFYFDNYIDSADFKNLHPTFSQWDLLPDAYSNGEKVCINKDQKALLMWSFTLPTSLSQFQATYTYHVALAVNWDRSASIAHKTTPEALIIKAESMPETKEFLSKFRNELEQSSRWNNYWIGSSSYGESSGYISPLQVNYMTDNKGSLSIGDSGVNWADLNINEQWENFPTVNIGVRLTKDALRATNCALDESPSAVSRYSPKSRRNEQNPEEFIYNTYNIQCSNNDYRYAGVHIFAGSGKYEIWMENKKQIASGKVTDSELTRIQKVFKQNELTQSNSNTPTTSQPLPTSIKPTRKNQSDQKKQIVPILIFLGTFTIITSTILITIFKYFKRKALKAQKLSNDSDKHNNLPKTINHQEQSTPPNTPNPQQ